MFNKLSSFPSDIWPTGPDDFESSRHDQFKKKMAFFGNILYYRNAVSSNVNSC